MRFMRRIDSAVTCRNTRLFESRDYLAGSQTRGSKMGHIFADIELRNPKGPDLEPVRVKALADTVRSCYVSLARGLAAQARNGIDARGVAGRRRSMTVPYVGRSASPLREAVCYVGALVLGDEVLLGAVPMEDMDLVVSPGRREITVDPSSPNIPHARVKRPAASGHAPATIGGQAY